MKKLSLNEIQRIFKTAEETTVKRTKLPEIKPDTFEKQVENVSDTLSHLQFQTKKVKFYPEDIEKMKNMSLEEKVEYKAKLKAEHKYTYEE